jgi:hypothetical protein
MHHNLYIDVNNLATITRFSRLQTPKSKMRKDPFAGHFMLLEMTKAILNFSKKFAATGLIIGSDSKNVWRKDILPIYKMRDPEIEEDVYKNEIIWASNQLAEFFRLNTSALVISVPRCEFDDIAGTLILNSDKDTVKSTVLSSDKDFIQLMHHNTSVYSVTQKEFRQSSDPMFDLFVKCIRGDRNDKVAAAMKGVKTTRLERAWNDDLEMLNLLEEVRPDGKKVGEVMDLNMQLIDLTATPDTLKQSILAYPTHYQYAKFREFEIGRAFAITYNIPNSIDIFDKPAKCFRKPPVFR